MTNAFRIIAAVAVAAVALAALLAFVFFGSSAEDEVSLGAALDAAAQSSESEAGAVKDAPSTSTTFDADDVEGQWTVSQNAADDVNAGSFVGYRVQEELKKIGSTTATGRTPGVTGSITIEGTTLIAATLTADMTSLTSDEGRRDRALASRAIEYNTFPTATFRLTEPVEFDVAALAAGTSQTLAITGELDLHGVVKAYTIVLEVQAVGATVVVVGTLDVLLSDHAIQKPVVGPVVSVADAGALELQVFFEKL